MLQNYRDVLFSLGVAIVLAAIIRLFMFSVYKVPMSSMQPNLVAGDFVIAFKLPYGFHLPFLLEDKVFVFSRPERGEVFVFKLPGDDNIKYIKRIVALAGDKVEIKDDVLYINDMPAEYEPIKTQQDDYMQIKWEIHGKMKHKVSTMLKDKPYNYGPFTVPEKSVFVLGDNRDASDDSRYWGAVAVENMEAKVFGIWFSVEVKSKNNSRLGKIRWQRIFQGI
tara:strand:- start:5362 stop:6027 length:666 start_codon:yes stop_codon:yes gene_type:complete